MGLRFVDFLETPIHQDAPGMLTAEHGAPVLGGAGRLRGPQARRRVRGTGRRRGARRDRPRDELRDHPGGRRPRRADARDRHDLRRGRPERAAAHCRRSRSTSEPILDDLHINDLLELVIQWGGSDLHLTSGSPPVIRVHGDLRPVTELPILNGSQIRQMVFSILTQKQREKFEDELELDTSLHAARARAASASTCSCSATRSAA